MLGSMFSRNFFAVLIFVKKKYLCVCIITYSVMAISLIFNINYHTKFGQSVSVKLKKEKENFQFDLSFMGNDLWSGNFEVDSKKGETFTYGYVVKENGKIVAEEKIFPQRVVTVEKHNVALQDIWRYDKNQINCSCSALKDCIFSSPKFHNKKHINTQYCLVFESFLLTPKEKDFEVILTGGCAALGNWNVEKGLKMERQGTYGYAARIENLPLGTQYKYVIRYKNAILWEDGNNRTVNINSSKSFGVINDGWLRIPAFTDWKCAGIVVPLFSLHSKNSNGIGDFSDLKRLIKWASEVGFSTIQLLPINDTTTFGSWRDSYPYNTTSVFALNPIYISLKDAGCRLQGKQKNKEQESVDYEGTFKFKMRILSETYKSKKVELKNDVEFDKFKKDNDSWLTPYSAYCALRDMYKTLDFEKWKGYETYDAQKVKVDKKLLGKAEFYKFVQFLAFSQMKSVKSYARKKKVILKGDIPIGVNLHSCDVWENSRFFDKDMSTGAPPDYFSEDGQNWGFPTYNWQEMKRDGYSWWKSRLKVMAEFFDAYRIDHVLGFFRIWEIPRSQTSAKFGHFSPALSFSVEELQSMGFVLKNEHIGALFFEDNLYPCKYCPAISAYNETVYRNLDDGQKQAFNAIYKDYFGNRNERLWEKEGTEKLREITHATTMLSCAEDLGMLPSCITEVLDRLNILSLEIQNMPKQSGVEYANVSKYPYNSVATISTHDMPSFRLWWRKFPDFAKRYARDILGMQENEIPQDANVEICTRVVESHLKSPSMLCLLSFQDWTSICEETRSKNLEAEQINNPADSKQYWRYKTHLSIEDLEKNIHFKEQIQHMISESNRNLFR